MSVSMKLCSRHHLTSSLVKSNVFSLLLHLKITYRVSAFPQICQHFQACILSDCMKVVSRLKLLNMMNGVIF